MNSDHVLFWRVKLETRCLEVNCPHKIFFLDVELQKSYIGVNGMSIKRPQNEWLVLSLCFHCGLAFPSPVQIDWEKSSSPINIFSLLSVFSCLHPTEVVSIIGVMSIWNDLFVVAFLFGTEKWLVKLKFFFYVFIVHLKQPFS